MKIYRETIVAGRTILQAYRASTRIKTKKGEKRKAKSNPTPEAVKKINLRNAIRNLTAILNNNFENMDYHLTLTYAGDEPSKEKAADDRRKFLRNIKSYCDRRGIEWKWVAVTEYENHRIHHHIVCSGIDPEVIASRWKHGWVNFKQLDDSGNYYRLAEYLIKETEKTFRLPESVHRKRYSQSGSIVIPQIKREEVSERMLHKELKPYDGYYIDEDTVNRYEHAVLGVDCLELIQVSLEPTPRLSRWNKGKCVKKQKRYKEHWPVQLDFGIGGDEQ